MDISFLCQSQKIASKKRGTSVDKINTAVQVAVNQLIETRTPKSINTFLQSIKTNIKLLATSIHCYSPGKRFVG